MTPVLFQRSPWLASIALAVALAAGTGCSPKIGDACSTAIDCSALGDRLCDVTQPGGYCTQFGCQPDGCPTEAACIVFRSSLDPACGDATVGKAGRFAQTFCMRTCESTSDCREGYACVTPAERAATLLDQKRQDAVGLRICVAVATIAAPPDAPPGICSPGTAPPLGETTTATSSSVAAGATASSSSSSSSTAASSSGQGGAGQGGAGQGGAGQGGAG